MAHRQSKHIVEEQAQCDPHKAIPLHYQPLKGDSSCLAFPCTSIAVDADFPYDEMNLSSQELLGAEGPLTLMGEQRSPQIRWQLLSKTLLLRKAAVVYYSQAKIKVAVEKYGLALKCIKKSLYCFGKCLKYVLPDNNINIQG